MLDLASPLTNGDSFEEKPDGLTIVSQIRIESRPVVQSTRKVRVVGAKSFLGNSHGFPVEIEGLLILTLFSVDLSKVIDSFLRTRMQQAKCVQLNCQSTPV